MAVLNYVFNISILIGVVIPLLNLLTGWFGGFFSVGADVDFDASVDASVDVSVDVSTDVSLDVGADAGMDAGTGTGADSATTSVATSAVIPFNIMCLCLFLMVFGAMGHMMKWFMSGALMTALLLAGCIVVAGLAYFAMYKLLVKRLRNNDASALTYHDLRGKRAEVTLTIREGSVGTISLRDSTGAAISFRAKIDADLKGQMPESIPTGEFVIITDVDKSCKLCYVSMPFNKLSSNGNKIDKGGKD